MTGNISEMNNPAFAGKRKGLYPNVYIHQCHNIKIHLQMFIGHYIRFNELSVTKDPNIKAI